MSCFPTLILGLEYVNPTWRRYTAPVECPIMKVELVTSTLTGFTKIVRGLTIISHTRMRSGFAKNDWGS